METTQGRLVDWVILCCLLTDFAMCLSGLINVETGVLKSLITIIYFSLILLVFVSCVVKCCCLVCIAC